MGIIIIKNMQAYGAPYAGYGYGGWAAGVDANNAAVDFSHASAASSDARFAALNTANYDSRVASRTESPGRSAMREPRTKRVPSLVAADLSATTTPFFGQSCSVDPLGEEIAGRQLRRHSAEDILVYLRRSLALSHSKNLMPFFVYGSRPKWP